jgi:hypothetical protein
VTLMRFIAVVMCATGVPACAHETITTKLVWTQEISRIIYRHCVRCHHAGGLAMSLVSYDEARPWAKAIRDEVTARRMPPWGAVKGVGQFRGDPSLTQIEIDMIVNWVEGGAPNGDDVYLPPVPEFKPETAPPLATRGMAVTTDRPLTLTAPADFAGVLPQKLAPHACLEITAYLPDGAVEHLIWLREWHPEWQRVYTFLYPIHLPARTRIVAYSTKPAEVLLTI